jgi:hypothetical protein
MRSTPAQDRQHQQLQFESIVSSSLHQITNGETEGLMTSLRQGWNIEKLILLKKATDKRISNAEKDFELTESVSVKLRIGQELSDLATLRLKIQIILNEKRN